MSFWDYKEEESEITKILEMISSSVKSGLSFINEKKEDNIQIGPPNPIYTSGFAYVDDGAKTWIDNVTPPIITNNVDLWFPNETEDRGWNFAKDKNLLSYLQMSALEYDCILNEVWLVGKKNTLRVLKKNSNGEYHILVMDSYNESHKPEYLVFPCDFIYYLEL